MKTAVTHGTTIDLFESDTRPTPKREPDPLSRRDGEVEQRGTVHRISFRNEENGWTILRMELDDGSTCSWVGTMPPFTVDATLEAVGVQGTSKYGPELKISAVRQIVPKTTAGIAHYLGSGAIPNIGPALARRIVDKFGVDTLDILEADPGRVREVPGIGESKAADFLAAWAEVRQIARIMAFLQGHGASPALAIKIHKKYKEQSEEIVRKNPYRLAMDIDGIGFTTADKIARSLDIGLEAPERAQAGVLHVLHEAADDNGHCYLTRKQVLDAAAELLSIATPAIDDAITELERIRYVRVERALHRGAFREIDAPIYLAGLHLAEVNVAERFVTMMSTPAPELRPKRRVDPADVANDVGDPEPPKPVAKTLRELVELTVATFEKDTELKLADQQRATVELCAASRVAVLTGGPGTGKSFTLKVVLALYKAGDLRVRMAAPTARAAMRMKEATGHDATTIHRLLAAQKDGGYGFNRQCPLNLDVLIVDEASMCDVLLWSALLDALPESARLLIVGDVDQLPSVGPGCGLRDIIDSGIVPTVRLKHIFRQADGSLIAFNAARINNGETPHSSPPERPGEKAGQFYTINVSDSEEQNAAERAADLVLSIANQRLPDRYGFNPLTDVQIITPQHKGPAGTTKLNERLQATLNPSSPDKPEIKRGEKTLRLGDKVRQKKNDNDRGVYNGDVGIIVDMDPTAKKDETMVVVAFDNERPSIAYRSGELDQLQHAYACTVHSVQGTESRAVVMVLLSSHFMMLSRNLVYTGITRAKEFVVLIAQPRALRIALSEQRKGERQTMLADRIRTTYTSATKGAS
jgi:exodeoxyribonuclease V alpha subunit